MRPTTRALWVLGGVLLALSGSAQAAVYGARVRWQGSSDATGYRVWVRPVGGSSATPHEVGMPPATNGAYSAVVDGLDPRTDYAVSVSATSGSGESARSNEVQVGYAQVAPLVDSDGDGLRDAVEDPNLNRVVDAGETDPTRADTDGDGVGDATDRCRATGAGAAVNAEGCACAQVSCDDGNACNGVETCQAGICQPGTSPSCDDGNPCTTDGCRAATGCTHTPVSMCTSCTANAQCDDGNGCTTDVCRAGTCEHAAVSNGTACSDGNLCNGAETCQSGTCTAGTALGCDDGDRCTTDSCVPATGCTHTETANCGACPDATVIPAAGGTVTGETSGTSRLVAGCEPSTAAGADALFAWTPSRSGTAVISTCGTATKFDTVLALRRGTCDAADQVCNDDTEGCPVDSRERLAGRQGSKLTTQVQAGETYYIVLDSYAGQDGAFTLTVSAPVACTAAQCDDGNPCTTDTCDPDQGCAHTPASDGGACDDGLFCTVGETCQGGTCSAGRPNCTDTTGACQTGNCDEASDRCFTSPRTDGTPCGDGNVCNGSETCQGGSCVASQAIDCDDHNPCTVDTCDAAGGCSHTPAADGTSCDDGSFCNGAETCRAGTCTAATPPDCDDGNSCTNDACNETEKRCGHESQAGCCATNADCADQDACTTAERCEAGRCVSDPVVCPETGGCTASTCDPQSGCAEVARPEGGACEDGDPCTHGERCTLGVCGPSTTATEVTPGGELTVTRFVLRPLGRRGQAMTAEGIFTGPWAADAGRTGFTTQLMSPDGNVLYTAALPAGSLHARRWRNRFVYTGPVDAPGAVGLRRLILTTTAEGTRVTIRAVVPRQVGGAVPQGAAKATAAPKTRFSWAVWVGDSCVSDPAVSCSRSGRGKRCG